MFLYLVQRPRSLISWKSACDSYIALPLSEEAAELRLQSFACRESMLVSVKL